MGGMLGGLGCGCPQWSVRVGTVLGREREPVTLWVDTCDNRDTVLMAWERGDGGIGRTRARGDGEWRVSRKSVSPMWGPVIGSQDSRVRGNRP